MTRAAPRLALLTLAAALLASPLVQAQTKKELAARVVALQQSDYENLGRAMAGQTAQQVMAAVAPVMAQVPGDKREAVGKDIQAEVRKFHDQIAPTLAEKAGKIGPAVAQPMLEERFSEDELKAVITFLESPASKKYREFGSQLPPALTEKLVAETRATVDPKLKTLEQTLQTKLRAAIGAPASAPAASTPPATKPAAGAKK
jgi:hypothetical protein